jgi:hypothetical protein
LLVPFVPQASTTEREERRYALNIIFPIYLNAHLRASVVGVMLRILKLSKYATFLGIYFVEY